MNKEVIAIFERCHSSKLKLIPVVDLNDSTIEEVIKKNDLDINKFYKVENKFYPYCYINGTVFVEIYSMKEDEFKSFMVKEIINQREREYKRCIDEKEYRALFTLIDKPFRLEWFIKMYKDIPEEDRLSIFKDIYSSMEYGFEEISKDMIIKMYKDYDFDRTEFDDVVTIYRGEGTKSNSYKKAYSWTTDLKIATFFANRFNSNGKIYKGKIKKEDILDYIDDRGEKEIITIGNKVFDVEEVK